MKTPFANAALNIIQLRGLQTNLHLWRFLVQLLHRAGDRRVRIADGVIHHSNCDVAQQFVAAVVQPFTKQVKRHEQLQRGLIYVDAVLRQLKAFTAAAAQRHAQPNLQVRNLFTDRRQANI